MVERQVFTADDGVRLVADAAGHRDAPLVILAHGGGQTRHSWSGAFRRLAEHGYRVVNFDARGHGESDWSADHRYPMSRRWADMETIVNDSRQSSAPVAIVGASMGGATALYGVSQEFRPNALILVDITPNSERAGMQRVRDFMAAGLKGFATLDDAADAVAAYNTSRPRPKDISGLKRNLRQHSDGRWYWHWDPGMVEIDIDQERALMARTFKGLEAAPELPLLLVRGLKSDVVTDSTVEEFRDRLPSLKVADVSGAGHMVAGDKNDAFLEAILGFLARHMPAGRP
ncbi:alpha/beta fold hydrolase [Henriciella aquimarina]|uniref:alpha/beta fold hydrolase n=1 Tax=Henriciella aquimarina TaxID=545261 RepID=UPI0009FE1555|nr:alpha/beta hydrolase [Henriciella aquimarina]